MNKEQRIRLTGAQLKLHTLIQHWSAEHKLASIEVICLLSSYVQERLVLRLKSVNHKAKR